MYPNDMMYVDLGHFLTFLTPLPMKNQKFSKNKRKKPFREYKFTLRSKTYDYCMLCCLTINDDGQTDRRWT